MSEIGTYLAAGAALAGVSEATGTTAFTPVGQQAREQQGDGGGGSPGLGGSIDLDLGELGDVGGGVNADVLEQLATAFQNQQNDDGPADALRAALEAQQQRADDWREEAQRRWEAAQEGDLDGDGENDSPISLPDSVTGGDDQGDEQDDGDDFKLQDLDGRGPYGVGTLLAAGGEAGAATGETAEKSVGFLNEIGNTGGQVFRALSGKEYSAADTLAEDIHGTGTRKINWDDYNPVSGVGNPFDLDLEEPDKTMSEMAVDNVRSKVSRDDSSSSSDDDAKLFQGGIFGGDEEEEEEPIISLPDSVTQKDVDAATTGHNSNTVGFTR